MDLYHVANLGFGLLYFDGLGPKSKEKIKCNGREERSKESELMRKLKLFVVI
jgi:hypothetical protein